MTNTDLNADLLKFARADLRTARKQGEILIGQTTAGRLSLAHAGGVYTLTAPPTVTAAGLAPGRQLAHGKAGAVAVALATFYAIA